MLQRVDIFCGKCDHWLHFNVNTELIGIHKVTCPCGEVCGAVLLPSGRVQTAYWTKESKKWWSPTMEEFPTLVVTIDPTQVQYDDVEPLPKDIQKNDNYFDEANFFDKEDILTLRPLRTLDMRATYSTSSDGAGGWQWHIGNHVNNSSSSS